MKGPWLVTGATGRIGSCLVENLVREGRRVRALCLPGDDRAAVLERVRVEIVTGDLGDAEAVGHAVQGAAGVYHLGAALTTRGADPSTIVRSISIGTLNLLEAIRGSAMSAVPFLLVSSTSVYYDRTAAPPPFLVTELAPVRPSTPYGAAKYSAELAVRAAAAAGLVEGVVVRPADTAMADELIDADGVFGRRWFVSGALRFHNNHPPGTFSRLAPGEYAQLAAQGGTLYVRRDEHGHEARIQIGDANAVATALIRTMDGHVAGEPPVANLVASRVWPIRSVVERIAEGLRTPPEEIVTIQSAQCERQWLYGSVRGSRLVGGDAVSNLRSS